MTKIIDSLGWILRRTTDTKKISAFYEHTLEIPIIRLHDENIIHWCGGTTVIGFNKIQKQQSLKEKSSENFIMIFKVQSIESVLSHNLLIVNNAELNNINDTVFLKDQEGIVFGIKEMSKNKPDYFDRYWNKRILKTKPTLNNKYTLRNNFLGITSIVIRSQNWHDNAYFYKNNFKFKMIKKNNNSIELAIDNYTNFIFMHSSIKNKEHGSRLDSKQTIVFRSSNATSIADQLINKKQQLLEKPHITADNSGKVFYFHDLSGQIFGIQTRINSDRIEDIVAEKLQNS